MLVLGVSVVAGEARECRGGMGPLSSVLISGLTGKKSTATKREATRLLKTGKWKGKSQCAGQHRSIVNLQSKKVKRNKKEINKNARILRHG